MQTRFHLVPHMFELQCKHLDTMQAHPHPSSSKPLSELYQSYSLNPQSIVQLILCLVLLFYFFHYKNGLSGSFARHEAVQCHERNVVLDGRPPPMSNSDKELTRKERSTLAQLRSGYCNNNNNNNIYLKSNIQCTYRYEFSGLYNNNIQLQ